MITDAELNKANKELADSLKVISLFSKMLPKNVEDVNNLTDFDIITFENSIKSTNNALDKMQNVINVYRQFSGEIMNTLYLLKMYRIIRGGTDDEQQR